MHFSGQNVEISPHAAQTSLPLAKKQCSSSQQEHQERDLMSPADFQTKHIALYAAKFNDSKKKKKN